MRKIIATVLAFALCLGLWGCGGDKEGGRFVYDIPGVVTSLDPQFVTDDTAKMILANSMEGLLRQQVDGTVAYGLAQSSETSADETVYTFTLREGLTWEDGSPLTAHDFVFGLRRLFGPGVVSPYAASFAIIKNAQAVLEGRQSLSALGIRADDDRTLVIELEAPSAFLGQLLSTPAALPCNEKFFNETRGRYGTDLKSFLANGGFIISAWSDERVQLKGNAKYYDTAAVLPQSISFMIGRENTSQLLLEGKSDAGILAFEQLQTAVAEGLSYETFDNTVWALSFNQARPTLADQQIRTALQLSIDRQQLAGELHDALIPTSYFIPPATLIFEKPYREQAGAPVSPPFNPAAAKELFQQALAAQGLDKLQSITVLVPERANQIYYASFIQQMWQRNLSLYVNIQQLPQQELSQRVAAGDYDIAILPFTSNQPDPSGLLRQFVTGAASNVAAYSDEEYDRTLTQAAAATTLQEAVRLFAKAEDLLLGEAVVVPLYVETTYFAMAKGVLGVQYSPYSGKLLFQQAERN